MAGSVQVTNTFGSVYWWVFPNVRQAVSMFPWIAYLPPLASGKGVSTIQGVVRTARLIAVLICISNKSLHCLRRRGIPQPRLSGKVLATGGILDPARDICLAKGQPGPLPFVSHPLFGNQRATIGCGKDPMPLVEDTNLVGDRKPPDGVSVDVSGDVFDSLVPVDSLYVFPSVTFEDRMDRGPSDLGTPEPESRVVPSGFGPGPYMRFVPLTEAVWRTRITKESPDSVRAINHDQVRCRPVRVRFLGVASMEHPLRGEYGLTRQARSLKRSVHSWSSRTRGTMGMNRTRRYPRLAELGPKQLSDILARGYNSRPHTRTVSSPASNGTHLPGAAVPGTPPPP